MSDQAQNRNSGRIRHLFWVQTWGFIQLPSFCRFRWVFKSGVGRLPEAMHERAIKCGSAYVSLRPEVPTYIVVPMNSKHIELCLVGICTAVYTPQSRAWSLYYGIKYLQAL